MKGSRVVIFLTLIFLLNSSISIMNNQEKKDFFSNIICKDNISTSSDGSIEDGSYDGPIWPIYQFDQKRTGLSPFNATGNPGRVKRVVESASIGSSLGGLIWILIDEDENIYCIDYLHNLTCYYSNFTIKWRIEIEKIEIMPIYYNHVLYVMKHHEFFAIDCETGSILWMKTTRPSSYLFYYLNHDNTRINIIYSVISG